VEQTQLCHKATKLLKMNDKLSYLTRLPFIAPALLASTFVHFLRDSSPILQQIKYRGANKQSYQKQKQEEEEGLGGGISDRTPVTFCEKMPFSNLDFPQGSELVNYLWPNLIDNFNQAFIFFFCPGAFCTKCNTATLGHCFGLQKEYSIRLDLLEERERAEIDAYICI
jgi:hypothetical protein